MMTVEEKSTEIDLLLEGFLVCSPRALFIA